MNAEPGYGRHGLRTRTDSTSTTVCPSAAVPPATVLVLRSKRKSSKSGKEKEPGGAERTEQDCRSRAVRFGSACSPVLPARLAIACGNWQCVAVAWRVGRARVAAAAAAAAHPHVPVCRKSCGKEDLQFCTARGKPLFGLHCVYERLLLT